MSISCGFFNSLNGDRKYNTTQMSNIIDSLINDGVFMSVGTSLIVKPSSGMTVMIGEGRAWFDHTWLYNDAPWPITLKDSNLLLPRIDTVVLEVNNSDAVRDTTIKVVTGYPATNPSATALVKSQLINQYPLCYIRVDPKVTSITQSKITNKVGTSDCPFVTGILQTINIDDLIHQWEVEWAERVTSYQEDTENWTTEQRTSFSAWVDNEKTEFLSWLAILENELTAFKNASEADFLVWFNNVKGQLSTDVAGNLQNEIDAEIQKEFYRYYGLITKATTIVKDATGNIISLVGTSIDAVSTTTFVKTNSVKTITTAIVPVTGTLNYTKTSVITTTTNGYTVDESFVATFKS